MIIGASQHTIGTAFENEQVAYDTAYGIFEEMVEYNEDGLIVTSNYCGIHKGPVLSFIESNLSAESIGTSFESIWDRYGDEIISGGEFGISDYDKKILNELTN
ncbi:hypothetical protein JCM19296_2809 [Nonlabens ulvanivorans]|uniref:Uncharacterized protein n=1 Tax=Nonlabens ulvanivorans TaxID=906888 RepID=A0A081DE58_NONUL|nr:hypothetical protein JCM19296_2809 [Nonlabens ulvanivorans]